MLVNGFVKRNLVLTVDQLKGQFRQHEVICTLSCAGNRRHTMRTLLKEVQGIDWDDGAIMNCVWKGPRLKDVLIEAGVDMDDHKTGHVEFACHQVSCQQDGWYGASLELERVLNDDADILLALEVFTPASSVVRKKSCRRIAYHGVLDEWAGSSAAKRIPGASDRAWSVWLSVCEVARSYHGAAGGIV